MWSVKVCMVQQKAAYIFSHGPCAQNGFTPLMEEVQTQHKELTGMLLDSGADRDTTDNVCEALRDAFVFCVTYYIVRRAARV